MNTAVWRPGRMTRSTVQRLRLLAIVAAASTVVGGCYGVSQRPGPVAVWPLVAYGVIGAATSSSIFGIELFAAGSWARLRRLPVPIAILGRAAAYGAIIGIAMLVFPWLFFGAPFSVTREGFAGNVVSSLWMTVALAVRFLRLLAPRQQNALLRRVRAALVPGGRLVVPEMVRDDDHAAPPFAATMNFNVLQTAPSGRVPTAGEFAALFRSAGLGRLEWHDLPGTDERIAIGWK